MSENYNVSRRGVLKRGATVTGTLVLGSVATSGTAAAGIGDGRVGHYTLNNLHLNKDTDEKIKNFVHDASPAKNHGTNHGAEVVKDGAVGKAFAFDGDGDYVEVEDDSSLDMTSQVTVAAWAYLKGSPNTKQAIVSKDWDLENALPYVIDLGTNHANEALSFGFYTGNWHDVTTGALAPQDEWFHVAGIFDTGTLRIYLNGEEAGETTGVPTSLPTNNEPVRIGRRTGSGTTRQDFNGKIDEARVYNRALSESEISELAAMGTDST